MRLYVGNLSWVTTDEGLRKAFEKYGTVESANVMKYRETGRSRGFGFVDMPFESEAMEAMEACDGLMLDGRNLRVNEATPREKGMNRGCGNGYGGHVGYRNRGGRGDRGGYGRW